MYSIEKYRDDALRADERVKARARAMKKLAPAILAYHIAWRGKVVAENMDGHGANRAIAEARDELDRARIALLDAILYVDEEALK